MANLVPIHLKRYHYFLFRDVKIAFSEWHETLAIALKKLKRNIIQNKTRLHDSTQCFHTDLLSPLLSTSKEQQLACIVYYIL